MNYETEYIQLIQKKHDRNASYRERHKDDIKLFFKEWYRKNKEKLAAKRREKRLKEKAAKQTCNA